MKCICAYDVIVAVELITIEMIEFHFMHEFGDRILLNWKMQKPSHENEKQQQQQRPSNRIDLLFSGVCFPSSTPKSWLLLLRAKKNTRNWLKFESKNQRVKSSEKKTKLQKNSLSSMHSGLGLCTFYLLWCAKLHDQNWQELNTWRRWRPAAAIECVCVLIQIVQPSKYRVQTKSTKNIINGINQNYNPIKST